MRRERAPANSERREATDSVSAVDGGAHPDTADAIAGGACQPRGGAQIAKFLGVLRGEKIKMEKKENKKNMDFKEGSRLLHLYSEGTHPEWGPRGRPGSHVLQHPGEGRRQTLSQIDYWLELDWSALGRVFFKWSRRRPSLLRSAGSVATTPPSHLLLAFLGLTFEFEWHAGLILCLLSHSFIHHTHDRGTVTLEFECETKKYNIYNNFFWKTNKSFCERWKV